MTSVLPGGPAALLDRADAYIASAERIAEAARFLTELALSGAGGSVDAVRRRATDASGDLMRAHGRYSGTAYALRTYAVELGQLHVQAQRFAEAEASNAHQAAAAENELLRLERTRDIHQQNGATDQVVQQWEDRIRATERRRDASEQNASDARQALRALQEQLDEAAQRAIAKINQAMEATGDALWSTLAKFVDDVASFFVTVGRWARDFLARVLEVILIAIAAVIVAVLVLVVIVAAIAVLAVAIVALAKVLAFLLTSPLFWGAVAVLVAYALTRIASDVVAPTPTVTALKLGDTDPEADARSQEKQKEAAEALAILAPPTSAEDLVDRAHQVDDAGAASKSVVDIQRVVDADGVVRWIVTLPSTQDWVALNGDKGASNDLDSNFALMLTPELRTQYERAVYEAMADAGIDPADPVMLVGFSQGGIMAGHLAANRQGDYNIQGILVVGSPIDHMQIPSGVNVVSIQHTFDPVPHLDGRPPVFHGSHWDTYGGGNDLVSPEQAHNVRKYAETVASIDKEQGNVISDRFSDFLDPGAEHSSSQHQWKES